MYVVVTEHLPVRSGYRRSRPCLSPAAVSCPATTDHRPPYNIHNNSNIRLCYGLLGPVLYLDSSPTVKIAHVSHTTDIDKRGA